MKKVYYVDPKVITSWWSPLNYISCVSIPCFLNFLAGIYIQDGWLMVEGIFLFLINFFIAFLLYRFGFFDWMSKREYKKKYFAAFHRFPSL